MMKKKKRSQARAAAWHAHKEAVLAGEKVVCEAMESFRTSQIPSSIPDNEKSHFEQTKEIMASKLARSVRNIKNSTVEEYIVEKIMRSAIIYNDDGNYYEKYLVKWVGFTELTWEPKSELEFNVAVDEFWDLVRNTPSHESHSASGIIHVNELNNQ